MYDYHIVAPHTQGRHSPAPGNGSLVCVNTHTLLLPPNSSGSGQFFIHLKEQLCQPISENYQQFLENGTPEGISESASFPWGNSWKQGLALSLDHRYYNQGDYLLGY